MRFVRKHKFALLAAGVYLFVFFFPTIFMQRVVSAADVFYNFDPWGRYRPVETQNPTLNDPPTSYDTMLSLVKGEPRSFSWDPYVACGIPGWGSSSAASLTPFIFFPTKLLPMPFIWSGVILLKFLAAFFFAYLWLREERLGKRGAAVGALIVAAAGPVAVRWMWQATNATPLYGALLWIALRTARGKRVPLWVVALVAGSYALAGFPAAMAYGAWVAALYFLVRFAVERRRGAGRRTATVGATVVLTLVAVSPLLASFANLVRRSGYLATRADAAMKFFFIPRHFWLFVRPDKFGNLATHEAFIGIRSYAAMNNYVEMTVYCGVLAIPLLLLGLFNRRTRLRWFWVATLLVILGCMFGVMPLARVIGALPGFKYSLLTRLQLILPLPVAWLAAAGTALIARRRFAPLIAAMLVAICAYDLGAFAGRFYPYQEVRYATVPPTPMTRFLQAQPRPFRIAPFFDYLWPNSSELIRVEDVRSHFSSEARYRQLLERIDPTAFANGSTVIEFNSLKFDVADPLVSMLGVRYLLEAKPIDIVKWSIFAATKPGVKETGAFELPPGAAVARRVHVDAEPFYAIELPVSVEQMTSAAPRLLVTLAAGPRVVWSRAFTPDDIAPLGKVYVPLRPFARFGDTLLLRVAASGMRVRMLKGAAPPGEAAMFYGRVTIPIIFDRELPDGRVFRNVGEVPRFHAVLRTRKMGDSQFLATKNIDFADEAIVTDPAAPLPQTSDARVVLRSYADDEQVVDVSAPAATLLASSEKLTPELGVTIDGREAKPVEINMLFAGVPVPAGQHRVVFARRIGRGWWPVAFGGFAALVVLCAWDAVSSARRRRGVDGTNGTNGTDGTDGAQKGATQRGSATMMIW